MGSPRIQQFLYFENVPQDVLEKIKERRAAASGVQQIPHDAELLDEIKQKFHVFTLEEAIHLQLIHKSAGWVVNLLSEHDEAGKPTTRSPWRQWVIKKLDEHDDVEKGSTLPARWFRWSPRRPAAKKDPPNKKDAPNISMNLGVLKKRWELYLAAVVGVLSQAVVIVMATPTAYAPHLQFNKAGLTVQRHSYRQFQDKLPMGVNRNANYPNN